MLYEVITDVQIADAKIAEYVEEIHGLLGGQVSDRRSAIIKTE